MSKPLSEITVDDVKEWALKQDRTKRNPMDENNICVYTGPDASHCIAGQFFIDHGVMPVQLNRVEGTNADDAAARFGMRDIAAIQALNDLQIKADHFSRCRVSEPWGTAIDRLFAA